MRYLLAFAFLAAFAAVNLVLNFYAPASVKLLLVPVFSLVLVAALAGVFRRRAQNNPPPEI